MYISVDMGGTNTRVVGSRGLERLEFINDPLRHRNTGSYENDLDFIIEAAKKAAGHGAIRAVGIGTPGTPNPNRTYIASASNIPHWNNRPLVQPVSEALGCPVYYDNDAVTAGLGEAYYGDYKDGDFHYLIWGTGIGGASIERNDPPTVSYASKLIWKPRFYEWEQECAGGHLYKHYDRRQPEELNEAEWADVIKKFGSRLLHYVSRFDPPAIVFGGGLADRHREAITNLGSQVGIPISVSGFKGDSGIVGGFGLIRYEQNPRRRPYIYQEDPEN